MKNAKKGMSLIEVVISMLILGLIVAGMYATFSLIGSGPNAASSVQLKAVNYARQTLEQLKNDVSADTNGRGAPLKAASYGPETIIAGATTFSRSYVVEDKTISGVNYKRVTVTVSWPD